ncbi:MAG TPA: glycosyl hydrolase family 28-related protein [Allosphingosinicella sp.]
MLNIRDFGAEGDGTTDDTDAFEAAIYEALPGEDKIHIFIPPGNYLLSRQIIPRRQIELVGAGMEVARLTFKNLASSNATMRGAIALGIYTTIDTYTMNPNNYPVAPSNEYAAGGADFSSVRHLAIFIEGTRPSDFHHGIWCAARATVDNVHVQNGGFKFLGGMLTVGTGTVAGNANMSYVANCRSFYATQDGFFTDGSDANAITFIGCKAWAPDRIGFHEASAFGNLYSGCLREGVTANTVSSYKSVSNGGINKSLFAFCYDEGDPMTGPHWDIGTPGLILQSTGAVPETNLAPGWNTRLEASPSAGLVTHEMINVSANGAGYGLGSATVRAARLSQNGLYVRAADGSLASMEHGGGDGVYLQRDGAAVMKIAKGAAIADANTAHALNATFSDAEVEAALNALGAKVNTILARMRGLTPTIAT